MMVKDKVPFRDVRLGRCELFKEGRCIACQHRCRIDEGKSGICGVRANVGGSLSCIRNYISYARTDPIERKPIFHFRPGTRVYSIGTVGCNFSCVFCQNFNLAVEFPDYPLTQASPPMIVRMAKKGHADGIAFTFNEPTVSIEFVRDVARMARKKGLYTVFVTNGYLTSEAIDYINPHIDSYIVGIKTFDEAFYSRSCGASLKRLKESVKMISKVSNHMEISYLVRNEDESFPKFLKFYNGLSRPHPLHLGKFFPDFHSDEKPTDTLKLIEYHDIAADEGVPYVYISDLYGSRYENTYCPECGNILIEREGSMGEPSVSDHCAVYDIVSNNLSDGGRCPKCGKELDIMV